MKIRQSNPVAGTSGVAAAAAPAKRHEAGTATLRSIADVASIAGLDEAELSPGVRAALGALMEEVHRLRGELERSRQRIEHLERLADEDSLLPMANRRAFVRELSRMVSFAERYGHTGMVLYFDVNNLKRINDQYGHAAGDAALKKIAEVLLANVRESDVVGRLGGDEFGVILVQVDEAGGREKAASLAALIAASPLEWGGKPVELSVAYGLHPLTGAGGADHALHAADRAMYQQKYGEPAPEPSSAESGQPLRR